MNCTCKTCNNFFEEGVNFCPKCGTQVKKNSKDISRKSLDLIILFYVAILIFSVISYFLYEKYPYSLGVELIIEAVFIALIIGFSSLHLQNILKLYKPFNGDYKAVLFSMIFPIISGLLVYYSIEYVNFWLFEDYTFNIIDEYYYTENPFFWAFLFVVIIPPIFEELAFRGFLFNQLLKVTSTKVTIVATSFIFALIHFSIISLVWIFPFGIVLGYLRSKYNTLWLGMIVHFIHNLIILLLDYYYFDVTI